MLIAIPFDLVPKRDVPIVALGIVALTVLALRAFTGVYFVLPSDVWQAVVRLR